MTVSVINKSGLRILLLLVILLAFGRAMLWLDAKALWWDESLTLQRAESDWGALLRAQLMIDDNVAQWPTTDQHPFTFFVLVGILIRLAGDSEFVLRFPSVMAVTAVATHGLHGATAGAAHGAARKRTALGGFCGGH
ncbi:MAG: hypothetical protein H6645_03590 [Caldilineaceae bacterium]|nr:hypothetical protein [Caldilineaceae bacterium]